MISTLEFTEKKAEMIFTGKKSIEFSTSRLIPGNYAVVDIEDKSKTLGNLVIFGGKEFSSVDDIPTHLIALGCETKDTLKKQFKGKISINYISYARRLEPIDGEAQF